MRISRTVKAAALAVVAGSLVLAGGPSASADPGPVSERYAARAGATVTELSLLGRKATFGQAVTDSSLDAVGRNLSATATGTGTDLSPSTRSVARFGDATAPGGTSCADPELGPVLDDTRSRLKGPDARLVPAVETAPACGGATVTGTPDTFMAQSTGGGARLTVKLPDALRSLVAGVTGGLTPETLATPVGDLVKTASPANQGVTQAVGVLNTVLGRIIPGVALPAMEPEQTVGSLLDRLGTGDLLHVDMAAATARNGGDPQAYLAEALADGGVVDVLPAFRGPGSAPLLRMTISRSRAAVPVERASMGVPLPVVENAVVRIEGDAAGGLPLGTLVTAPGLRSGAGHLEVGPGQSVSVLCDGPVAPLCSEITVGAAQAPVTLPSGATHAESTTVTVHLFKGLDTLTPGTALGTALAQPAVVKALGSVVPSGTVLGDATGIPGIRLVSGGVVAEAGGTRVLGAEAVPETPVTASADPAPAPAPVQNLPRTGGLPFSPAAAPLFLCTSAALGGLTRRLRRS